MGNVNKILVDIINNIDKYEKPFIAEQLFVVVRELSNSGANVCYSEGAVQPGAVAEEKLIFDWKEGELISGDPLFYLDDCHGVSVDNYVDHIDIKFYQRIKENGKTYCRVTKKHTLDVAKLAEALKLLEE